MLEKLKYINELELKKKKCSVRKQTIIENLEKNDSFQSKGM